MSILLSAYFPEGIVFAADKNITLLYQEAHTERQDVEVGDATKVIPWANRRAVVGYRGMAQLAGLSMDEWMRQFAACTRDFDDLPTLAMQMRDAVQRDFDEDYPQGADLNDAGVIVHLGGSTYEQGIATPSMYYIHNVSTDPMGGYQKPYRQFEVSDELHSRVASVGARGYRACLGQLYAQGGLVWFNNGCLFPVFNMFKQTLWQTLLAVRASPYISLGAVTLADRVAYCKMAVELFGSFFRHHLLPSYRAVGGGVDAEWVPWAET